MPRDPIRRLRDAADADTVSEFGKRSEALLRKAHPELFQTGADPRIAQSAIRDTSLMFEKTSQKTGLSNIKQIGKSLIPESTTSALSLGSLPSELTPTGEINPEFGETIKNSLPIAGSVVGGALAGLPGMVVGGGIGGSTKSVLKGEGPGDAARAFRDNAAFELAGNAVAAPVFGLTQRVGKWFKGTDEVGAPLQDALERLGGDVALQDISDTPMISGLRRIIGQIPGVTSKFRNRQAKNMAFASSKAEEFVSELTPNALMARKLAETNPAAAAALTEAAHDRLFSGFNLAADFQKREEKILWDGLNSKLKTAGLETLPDNTIVGIARVLDDAAENSVKLINKNAKPGGPEFRRLKSTDAYEAAQKYTRGLADLPEVMSVQQLIKLKQEIGAKINEIAEMASPDNATRLLGDIKEGVELDIEAALSTNPGLKQEYDAAKKFSYDWLTLLAGSAARKARGVQKTFGFQGSRVAAEGIVEGGVLVQEGASSAGVLLEKMVDSGSSAEVRQLGAMLRSIGKDGEVAIKDVLGRRIENATRVSMEKAAERGSSSSFSAEKFVKSLGLSDPNSKEFVAAIQLFKEAGVDPRRVNDITNMFRAYFGEKNAKVSQYLARKIQLGGAASIVGAGGIAGGAIGNDSENGIIGAGLGAILPILLLRGSANLVTKPFWARRFIAISNPNLGSGPKAMLVKSLLSDKAIRDLFDPNEPQEMKLLEDADKAMSNVGTAAEYVSNFNENTLKPLWRDMRNGLKEKMGAEKKKLRVEKKNQ